MQRVTSEPMAALSTFSISATDILPRPVTPTITLPLRSHPTMPGTCSSDTSRLCALPPRFLGALRLDTSLVPFSEKRKKVSSASTRPCNFRSEAGLYFPRSLCRHRNAVGRLIPKRLAVCSTDSPATRHSTKSRHFSG